MLQKKAKMLKSPKIKLLWIAIPILNYGSFAYLKKIKPVKSSPVGLVGSPWSKESEGWEDWPPLPKERSLSLLLVLKALQSQRWWGCTLGPGPCTGTWIFSQANLSLVLFTTPQAGQSLKMLLQECQNWDFPGGTVVKNPPASAGDTGSSPGPGRFHVLQSN